VGILVRSQKLVYLVLKVETLDNFTPTIGTGLQNKSEGCVIDLGSFTGQSFKVDTRAISDAAYNNHIGFYAVADDIELL
jgi:hypothetical protein